MGNGVNPIVLEKGLKADFIKAFNALDDAAEIAPMTMKTSSSSNKEKYGWLGQTPGLTEWTDQRTVKNLIDFDYEIVNKHYESTIQIDRDELADDQIGNLKVRVSDLAEKAKRHPVTLFYNALINGTTDLCYDGQAFFSNSHASGVSGTQDNLLAGAGATVANLKTDFTAATTAMRTFKDDQGQPLNLDMSLTMVVPPALEGAAREFLNASLISSTTNIYKGAASLVVSPYLTDVNDWYLMNSAGTIKPIVQQNRQSPVTASLMDKSDFGFRNRLYLFGIDYRVGFGYGLWQKAIKVVNS